MTAELLASELQMTVGFSDVRFLATILSHGLAVELWKFGIVEMSDVSVLSTVPQDC